jgi:hypothetical protein
LIRNHPPRCPRRKPLDILNDIYEKPVRLLPDNKIFEAPYLAHKITH